MIIRTIALVQCISLTPSLTAQNLTVFNSNGVVFIWAIPDALPHRRLLMGIQTVALVQCLSLTPFTYRLNLTVFKSSGVAVMGNSCRVLPS